MRDEWTMLHLTVRDGATKRPMPARIHIKQADGSCYVPPAALDTPFDETSAPAVITAEHFRKNLHLCRSADIRSAHVTSGEAVIPIPTGELTLHTSRGHEYRPDVQSFNAKAGTDVHVDVALNRVDRMAERGWHSGDMHVHFTRTEARDDFVLAHLMAAEDLPAVNNMVYKDAGKVEAPQRTMGHASTHHQLPHSHHVVAGGEEFRDNNTYGHMIAAGIREIIEPISTGEQLGRRECYPFFAKVCDAAHEQGGIAGWAHGGTLIKLNESLPAEAAMGKLDFVESIQFNTFLGFAYWYRLLNCGIRLAATGGSDFPFSADVLAPWYPNLGLDRTYVRLDEDEPFTYDAYIEGIRAGRTFASNGPLLTLAVDGAEPGNTLLREMGDGEVHVIARVVSPYPMERLEIVVNGGVEYSIDGSGGQTELACDVRLPLKESIWIAARARGRVEPDRYGGTAPWNLLAHTSPVYVLKAGRPIICRADATAMADYVRNIAQWYSRGVNFGTDEQRAEVFAHLSKAIAFYDALLRR